MPEIRKLCNLKPWQRSVLSCSALALLLVGAGCSVITRDDQPHFFEKNFLDRVINRWPLFLHGEDMVTLGLKAKAALLEKNFKGKTLLHVKRELGQDGIYCVYAEDKGGMSCRYCVVQLARGTFYLLNAYAISGFYWEMNFFTNEGENNPSENILESKTVRNIHLSVDRHNENARDNGKKSLPKTWWTEEKRSLLCDRARYHVENEPDRYDGFPIKAY